MLTTALGIATAVFTILGIISLGYESVAYGIGIFIGSINSIFNSFQYIGADCALITSFQTIFYVGFPVFLILYTRNKLKL